MRSPLLCSLLSVVLLALVGCRQADAPIPAPQGDDPNRIADLSRDLMNVARGDPNGPQEFTDDLALFVARNPAAQPAVAQLATRTIAAVRGANLPEPAARELANQLWMTTRVVELSDTQIADLGKKVETTLTTAGIPAGRATPVAAQVAEVQKVVRTRQRRWYEMR
jgi:hypothetical protein